MRKTSASVLALLFASTKAVRLNEPCCPEGEDSGAMKVHVLDIGANAMSNNGHPEFPAFPGGIRTAFYAQTGEELNYDNQNGLWRQGAPKKDDPTAVLGPPEGSIGTAVYDHAMDASEGIAGDRSKSYGPSLVQRKTKVDPISPENYDPWVYKMSKENMGNFPQWHEAETKCYGKLCNEVEFNPFASAAQTHHHHKHQKPQFIGDKEIDEEVQGFASEHTTGLNQHHKHHKHHKKPDIAERGMDEEVHGFATEILPPLNTRVRSDMPFIPNGSDDKAFKGASLHQHKHHKKPDVAERGMDEEVHGFVTENLPPLNTRVRSDMPFIPNGSDGKAFKGASLNEKKHHRKHHKKDIAERGMDEEVHGFVWEALPPLNTRVRSTDPFIPNGSDPSAIDPSFAEKKHHHKHHKKDIAERGMDEEVHGFVWEALPPLNTRVRSTDPFIPNGSDPSAIDPSFAERTHHHKHHKKPDVAERGMDEEVHGFVHEAIPPLNVRKRTDDPFIPNGSAIGDWDQNAFYAAHPDIIGKPAYDSAVQGFVSDNLPPLSEQWGSDHAWSPNGSQGFHQKKHHHGHKHNKHVKDIAERGMDTDVQQFASEAIPPLNTRDRAAYGGSFQDLPPKMNGVSNQWGSFAERPYYSYEPNGGQVYAQHEAAPKKDIANKEVRPDVYVTVHKMINPVAMGRFSEPRPKEVEETRTWDDGPKPKDPPKPEYKFEKPEEVDEDALKAKREKAAKEGKEKAKKAKAAQDEEDAKPDEDAKDAKPAKKEGKKEEGEEKEKEEAPKEEGDEKKDDKKEDKKEEKKEGGDEKKEDKKEEKKEEEPKKEEKKALVQVKSKADGDKKEEKKDGEDAPKAPEKVHILEPVEYKEKADTNTPNIRTTFYDKKQKKAQI